MLDARLFQALGFWLRPDLFSEAECARLRAEADAAPAEEVSVVRGRELVLDPAYRRTARAALGAETDRWLTERLQALRGELETHHGCALPLMQPVQLLVYRAGDFFGVHTDSKDRPDVLDALRERRVSLVVPLGHTGGEDGSAGGLLQFHALFDDARMRARGYPLAARPGTAIAFDASLPHEVTPVLRGRRYSLVTWFG